jgi:hypothetical protein
MITQTNTRRGPIGPYTPYEETVMAALLAVDLTVRTESEDDTRTDEDDWDEVHDAALESFPASDAPSWGALRVGPPVGDRFAQAAA